MPAILPAGCAASRRAAGSDRVRRTPPRAAGHAARPVHAGGTIWIPDGYVTASSAVGARILGFSATAGGRTPLRTIPLGDRKYGFPMTSSVAGGTLFHQTWGDGSLVGYRVPGT